MNLLSLICIANAFVFGILGVFTFRLNLREPLNRINMLIEFSFAIWALTYAFMFASPTADEAMLWHKVGSVGWIMISVLTFHFFLTYTERLTPKTSRLLQALLYLLPTVLVIVNFSSPQSIVARSFIQSNSGWGWTYTINTTSLWFWVYCAYMILFFAYAFISFLVWVSRNQQRHYIKRARLAIIFCALMLTIGSLSDIVMPLLAPTFPPLAITLLIFWGLLLYRITQGFRFLGIEKTATADMILQTVMSPILLLDANNSIILCNQALLDLLKLNREQLINRPVKEFVKSRNGNEVRLVDSHGQMIDALASFSRIETNRGNRGTVISLQDITHFKQIEQDLSWRNEKYRELSVYLDHMANYDDLTGLPNRWQFFAKLDEAIEEYEKTGFGFTLIFIDLDGFKAVNDSFGHQAGDQLLVAVAEKFSLIVRKDDLIARIGGDEFVLLFADAHDGAQIDAYQARLDAAFADPIIINDDICPVGLSIGISRCPDDGISVDGLVRAADQRMYQDKIKKKHVG